MKNIIYLLGVLILGTSCKAGELVDPGKSRSYFNKGGHIYYSPLGNWMELGYDDCNADIKTFEVLAESIAKDKNSIFSGYKPQHHVDYATFNVDINKIPKDKNYVYEVGYLKELIPLELEGIDVESFEYLVESKNIAHGWAKDRNQYYLRQKVVNVHPKTLKFLTKSFFHDKDSLYADLHKSKIKTVAKINKTPKMLTNEYVISDFFLYYLGRNEDNKVELKRIAFDETEVDTRILSADIISTSNQIIYYGEYFENADAGTFEILSGSKIGNYREYCKDKNNVYLGNQVIDKANPESFKLLSLGFSKDDKYVFHKTTILKEADPKSFGRSNENPREWGDDNGNRFNLEGERIN